MVREDLDRQTEKEAMKEKVDIQKREMKGDIVRIVGGGTKIWSAEKKEETREDGETKVVVHPGRS